MKVGTGKHTYELVENFAKLPDGETLQITADDTAALLMRMESGVTVVLSLSVMGAHVAGVGKALEAAVGRYNQFVGSLESQVLTQARKFEDLSVDHEAKTLDVLEPLDSAPRPLSKLSVVEDAPSLTGPP